MAAKLSDTTTTYIYNCSKLQHAKPLKKITLQGSKSTIKNNEKISRIKGHFTGNFPQLKSGPNRSKQKAKKGKKPRDHPQKIRGPLTHFFAIFCRLFNEINKKPYKNRKKYSFFLLNSTILLRHTCFYHIFSLTFARTKFFT